MSFFDKMKASVGIGAVKVDTVLEKESFHQGEKVQGKVLLLGGKVEQEINGIYLYVMTNVVRESDDRKYVNETVLLKVKVSDSFEIKKGESKELPFQFELPENLPISIGNQNVWIKTELDVSFALDPKDNDHIEIKPSATVNSYLKGIESLGFQLRKVETLPFRGSRNGIIQEFEFIPTSGEFKKRFDEVEMAFVYGKEEIHIYFEFDRKARGLVGFLEEAMDMDESRVKLTVPAFQQENIEQAKKDLKELLIHSS